MLFRVDDIQILFNKIQKKALKGGVTVVIFVSYEIDSLCAAHILTVTRPPLNLQFTTDL